MQINSTTTDSKLSKEMTIEDIMMIRNEISEVCLPDSGDEYL